jgi:hypothetical protein
MMMKNIHAGSRESIKTGDPGHHYLQPSQADGLECLPLQGAGDYGKKLPLGGGGQGEKAQGKE